MQQIVLAANADADQPWVADAAADLARQLDGKVAVICVDELQTEILSTLPREEARKPAEAAAQRAVDRLSAEGVEATMTVRSGPALERILEYADEIDADVIVVGSSVRGRLKTALLGSVPIGLINRSKRPVLAITAPSS
jgi:nucleotide-binding universal stress UspA family protein